MYLPIFYWTDFSTIKIAFDGIDTETFDLNKWLGHCGDTISVYIMQELNKLSSQVETEEIKKQMDYLYKLHTECHDNSEYILTSPSHSQRTDTFKNDEFIFTDFTKKRAYQIKESDREPVLTQYQEYPSQLMNMLITCKNPQFVRRYIKQNEKCLPEHIYNNETALTMLYALVTKNNKWRYVMTTLLNKFGKRCFFPKTHEKYGSEIEKALNDKNETLIMPLLGSYGPDYLEEYMNRHNEPLLFKAFELKLSKKIIYGIMHLDRANFNPSYIHPIKDTTILIELCELKETALAIELVIKYGADKCLHNYVSKTLNKSAIELAKEYELDGLVNILNRNCHENLIEPATVSNENRYMKPWKVNNVNEQHTTELAKEYQLTGQVAILNGNCHGKLHTDEVETMKPVLSIPANANNATNISVTAPNENTIPANNICITHNGTKITNLLEACLYYQTLKTAEERESSKWILSAFI